MLAATISPEAHSIDLPPQNPLTPSPTTPVRSHGNASTDARRPAKARPPARFSYIRALMFDSLSDRLAGVFDKLRGRGALTELDVRAAMREVRIALLEADVALPVVKDFIDGVTARAIGAEVTRSVTPGQQVVKIVHDALVEMLGGDAAPLNLGVTPPAVIMVVGLQGSGKTTTTAKLAKRLTEKSAKKVLMASLDVARPAAQEQLRVLGEQTGVATLPIVAGQSPVDIARRARTAAKLQGFDVLLLDTAGRLHVDAALMAEMKAVAEAGAPDEILLVVDSLTGQDAVNVAQSFSYRGRADRRDPDADGRRRARRCGAVDARGDQAADQVRRDRREARRARGVRSRPRRRAHPRHGRHRRPRRARERDVRGGECREARREDGQGPVRHGRPADAAPAR